MGLRVASLNSGSNGNCYYVGTDEESVLIDAGISCRETERRMKRLGLNIKKVKAIFITHEHADHIKGAARLSKRHSLPVYVTPATLLERGIGVKREWVVPLKAWAPVTIGGLTITGFPKRHDAADPLSFIVSGDNVNVGIFTDVGFACENVISHFGKCHAAFLEANYDEHMLATGRYPLMLKERIRGGYGHLSNNEAARLFIDHRPPFMSHVFLSHLSQNNNTPDIVESLFTGIAGKTRVVIASRHKESEVYTISPDPIPSGRMLHTSRKHSGQLSLFS